MLLIYIPKITPRNRYTFKTIFKTYLLLPEYQLTSDLNHFSNYEGSKFSYSTKKIGEEIRFSSVGLLEQNGIKEQNVVVSEYNNLTTLFPVRAGVLPYDPFAATFYLLSRYEEYLPHVRDQYDRFTAKESFAKANGFLQTAVVDRWTNQIKFILQQHFPSIEFPDRKFNYIPTIDIDNAFAYKNKGILRTSGSLLKSIAQLDFKHMLNQVQVLLGKKKDPFDTYNYQLNVQKRYGIKPIYFILIGDYGLNDKNLNHENRHFKKLIKSIADYAYLGIHPSFGSNKSTTKLKVEISRLQHIVKREITRSRQHFLKLSLPETYRNLIDADIEEDYTMGFANELGFRAGTCTPYPFYDLDEEVECKLMVYPFQIMEATLKYYLKLSPEESIVALKKIIDEVKEVKGTLVSLWHNESLSEQEEWVGWRKVYEEMIEYTLTKNEVIPPENS